MLLIKPLDLSLNSKAILEFWRSLCVYERPDLKRQLKTNKSRYKLCPTTNQTYYFKENEYEDTETVNSPLSETTKQFQLVAKNETLAWTDTLFIFADVATSGWWRFV